MGDNVVAYSSDGSTGRCGSISIGKILSTMGAVLIVIFLTLGLALSSSISAMNGTRKTNAILAGMDSVGSNVVTSTLGGIVTPAAKAYADDCGSVKSNSDGKAGFNSCIDQSLGTDLKDLRAVDKNGNECAADQKVDESGKCVKDYDADGTVKDNPLGFFNKMKNPNQVKDDPSADNPSIMDIISMIAYRWVLPGYYVNSDFQNFNGNNDTSKNDGTTGNKVAPGTGTRGLPAEIGGEDKNGNPVQHMYAWRDMQCKTGLTDPVTGEEGPNLRTSNCDVPGAGTEAIQDLVSIFSPGGLHDAETQTTKTPFDMGYSRDLLPTSDVPLDASHRSDKYTGLELFGYNLHWTSYNGEFDRIKVRTQSSMSLMANLHNTFKIVGNSITSGWQAVQNQTQASIGQMLDDDNSFWDRVGGFVGVINPFKKAWEFVKSSAYSAMSDIAYMQEVQMATYGSWYRPDFPNTVYGARGLTTIEKSALLSLITKTSMIDSYKKALSSENWDFNETKIRSRESLPTPPRQVYPKDRPESCPKDGDDKTETGDKVDPACNRKKQLQSWNDWKGEHPELVQKAQDIGIDLGKYDGIQGDADIKYKTLKEDWGPALQSYVDRKRQENTNDLFQKFMTNIWGATMENVNILGSISDAGTMYCQKDDGTPDGTSSNLAIQNAVAHNFMKNPGREAYDANGKWQCNGEPRPSIVGGLMGSSRKDNDPKYHDTRRDYYKVINFGGFFAGQLDKLSQRLLTLSQDLIVILNTLIEWSFMPILDKLGVSDLVKTMLVNLRKTIYMQLVTLFIAIAALGVMFRVIRGHPIQSFKQLATIIIVFFLGIMILFNPDLTFMVVDSMPAALERASIGLIFNSSGEDKICKATGKPMGTLSAGSFSGVDGNGLGFNPDAQVRTLQCRIWETFVLAPWAYGQFGTSVNNLYATGYAGDGLANSKSLKLDKATQDIVGNAPVDMGGGTVVHNWALYQVAHTTDGTITTDNTKKSAREIDKNIYKLVDAQAGPNNAKGRDTSHMDAWAGDSGSRFFVSMTALPAAILGLYAIGGLAIKKISYTLMMSLLLLAAPFMLLVGLIPGKGTTRLRQYCFEVLGTMLKRVMTVALMAVALEIMIEVTGSVHAGWPAVVIGIYAVCLMVIFYGNQILSMLTAKVNNAAGSWSGSYDRAKSKVMDSSVMANLKRDAHDIFVGGTGAALGIIVSGSAGTNNKRRDVSRRLENTFSGMDSIIKRTNGTGARVPIYDGGVLRLDDSVIRTMTNGVTPEKTIKFKAGVGQGTRDIINAWNSYNQAKQRRHNLEPDYNIELKKILNNDNLTAEQKTNASLRLKQKYEQEVRDMDAAIEARKRHYLMLQKDYEKRSQVMKTLEQGDLGKQLSGARTKTDLKNALVNTVKADWQLTEKEHQDNGSQNYAHTNKRHKFDAEKNMYGDAWLDETDDPSVVSEAKDRIDRIMHRSHLSKLRTGMANPFLEARRDFDESLDREINEANYNLDQMVKDGYYGVDKDGKTIHNLNEALGVTMDEDQLKELVLSSPDSRKIEADMQEAIATGDWRAVRNDIGNQQKFTKEADDTVKNWGFNDGVVDDMITQQLISDGKDPTDCTIRDRNEARAKVIETIGIDADFSSESLVSELAASNVVDSLNVAQDNALRKGLGEDYLKIVAEQQSGEGQAKLANSLSMAEENARRAQDQVDMINGLIKESKSNGWVVSSDLIQSRKSAVNELVNANISLDNARKEADQVGEISRDWKNKMMDARLGLYQNYSGRKLNKKLQEWNESYNTLLAIDDQKQKIEELNHQTDNESAINDNNYKIETAGDAANVADKDKHRARRNKNRERSRQSTSQSTSEYERHQKKIDKDQERENEAIGRENEERSKIHEAETDNSNRTADRVNYSGTEQTTSSWLDDMIEQEVGNVQGNEYKAAKNRKKQNKGKDKFSSDLNDGSTPSDSFNNGDPPSLETPEVDTPHHVDPQQVLNNLNISEVFDTYYDRKVYRDNSTGRTLTDKEAQRRIREETRRLHGQSDRKRNRTHKK